MKIWVKVLLVLLCLIFVIVSILFYSNRAAIYADIGKYYTKRDDYIRAQIYYQKSYDLGNRDKNFRENYVNLLINSPLTLEAQERLVSIAEGEYKDSASESAKYFLYNLKRAIHNKYPNNYIQQASFNQKIVHWGKIPITYSFKQTKGVPQEIITAVNDAFDSWERASSARIRFERVSVNADIVVSFTNNIIRIPKFGEKYIIAYTVPDITSNKLNRMDLTLNLTGIDGVKFTPNQMYNIALHEIFHALGFMGHSFDNENIMYITQTGESMINDERKIITDSDKATLELFYKVRPDITNAQELIYEYIPYPVIGDNAEINYAKAIEAKKYIKKVPRVSTGYIDLAQTLLNQEDYEGAILNLKKALFLSNNDNTTYLALYNLAVAYYFDKDYEFALFYAQKAMDIKDNNELHFLLAEIYKNQNDNSNAIKEYTYLVSNEPDNIEYVVNLTNIYISRHNYLKARKVLKNYIKRNPKEKNNPRFKPCRLLLL